uniref:Uncharacterized protein n=1 Tax=uncultured organism MedDCM-OCT-S04-C107 TaxID=743606 RepID=D6PJ10_9ZZZZ|nr:hypothetical protein [uncultured organism MedDCM-OCT-S04-C107]
MDGTATVVLLFHVCEDHTRLQDDVNTVFGSASIGCLKNEIKALCDDVAYTEAPKRLS